MLIKSLWELDVKVGPTAETTQTSLIRSGAALADHLLGATTSREAAEPLTERWWVGTSRPITIVERQATEVAELPAGFRSVSLESSADLTLWYGVGPTNGVFVARRQNPAYDRDELNQLYVHLLRLHTEVETFFAVARLLVRDPPMLAYGSATTHNDALASYFDASSQILSGGFLAGQETDAVLSEAFTIHRRVDHKSYDALLSIVAAFNVKAADRYRRLIDPDKAGAGPINFFLAGSNPEISMTTIDNRCGNFYNSGIIGSDNFVQDGFKQIQASGASDQLNSKLQNLVEAVSALAPHVSSAAQGDQLGKDVQALTAEATVSQRRPILQATGDAIVATAKTIGQYGFRSLRSSVPSWRSSSSDLIAHRNGLPGIAAERSRPATGRRHPEAFGSVDPPGSQLQNQSLHIRPGVRKLVH